MIDPTKTGGKPEIDRDDFDTADGGAESKRHFSKPKLTYVKPKIERHAIPDVTAGFFGTFYT